MTERLPDPAMVRLRGASALERLGLPRPPRSLPLLWAAGERVALRRRQEIEARLAVVSVVLASCYGMPQHEAMAWLLEAHLLDEVTEAEWGFIVGRAGDRRVLSLHHEAAFALAWVLGIALDLDPTRPASSGLLSRLPNLPAGEPYPRWRARSLASPREPVEVAAELDLYTCLDWAAFAARGRPAVDWMNANTIGQRRLTLEWTLLLPDRRGPSVGASG